MVAASRIVSICLACLAYAGAAAARADDVAGHVLVPGYFNPKTRTFTALVDSLSQVTPAKAMPAATATPKVVQGTLTIKAVVTLDSSIPANANLTASASVSGGSSFATSPSVETAYGTVQGQGTVSRSGAKAVATASFRYHMSVDGSASTLSVNMYFNANVSGVPSLQFSKVIPIPANGAKTVVSFPGAL